MHKCGASLHDMHVPFQQHVLKQWLLDIFSHYICWMFCALNLAEFNGASPDLVLCPESSDIQVSDLAQAATTTYPYGSGRVGMNLDLEIKTEILGNGL